MATASSGSSHLGVTENQKRWLVAGIALNKILIPQIRPFVEQGINTEYNKLKKSHNIHGQSTAGRLQRWPPTCRKLLKYENINGNDVHVICRGKFNYSLFDCRVMSHVDFARLYVENYMAHFTAFDDQCDASAVLTLLGVVPVFSAPVQTAAGDVRMGRNDWAHCVFGKWDQVKYQQSFIDMEHLVRVMALPAADEGKLLGELKDWETKGTHLCMNSSIDPALLQLVQQGLQSLQDDVRNMSVEFEEEKRKVQHELKNVATSLEAVEQRVQMLEDRMDHFEGAVNQKIERLESSKQSTEDKVNLLQACPEKLVELIKRDYKGAVLCPFPWCEDELQLELSNIFTRLKIISKKKERARRTDNIVNMTDVFAPHKECDKPRVVLIEGEPGVGKTTYCQKLAYDWSIAGIPPEASFPKVEILLLLKCRDMKTADIEEDINDQLLPLDADKKEKENFFEFIRRNQSKILLVLDGLDELRHDMLQGFLPLIKGKVFSNVYLMLTARHEAGTEVRRYCDTLLEIVGYTNEDADSYIKKYFSNHENPSLAKKMIKKLNWRPQLRELTANPLNTALLCLVFEDSEGKFPSNRTKLYDELVSCALRRYCAKKEVSLYNNDPIEAFAEQLSLLGKMALEALLNNQAYFTGDELKCQSTEFLEFGFLSREASVSKIRPNPSYSFTHKTFQEYFAAFHLAHQLLKGDKEKVTLLDQLSPVDKYWQVWGFLITAVASKSDDVAAFLVSCLCDSFCRDTQISWLPAFSWADEEEEDSDNSSDDYVFDVTSYDEEHDEEHDDEDEDEDEHDEDGEDFDYNEDADGFEVDVCKDDSFSWSRHSELSAFEGNVRKERFLTETCNLIADCEGGRNKLKDYQKKMIHTLASCFALFKVHVLSFRVHNMLVLCEYLKENSALTELTWCFDLHELALETIKHVLQTSQRLAGLHLLTGLNDSLSAGLHLRTDLNSTSLAPALQSNSTLTHLNLPRAKIRISGAKALGEVLQSNRTLTHLNLHDNKISHIGAQALAKGLQSNNVLTYLDLSFNFIGDQGAVALAHVLESNHTLTYLDVGNFEEFLKGKPNCFLPFPNRNEPYSEPIGESGALAIAHALQSNCSLTYLNLEVNNVNDSAAAALGQALQSNCTLTHFYLRDIFLPTQIHFGNSGAVAFAKSLQSSGTQLTRLDLCNTSINSSVAMALAEGLQSNRSLERLDLGNNEIECSGAEALAKALKSNRALTHLQLRSNHIGDSGATEFAETLRYNDTLTLLDLRDNRIGELGKHKLRQLNPRTSCTLKFHEQR
ncbi:protein NLRC3-like [Montipora foliosa]|uniref:protein NLRC3-like n=1 Tax=Montipora foliosa TaxID=591990 RepID=UPI0035F1F7D7